MQPDAAGSEAQHKLVLKHCMDESKDVEGDHNDDVGALETQAKGQQRELGWMPSDASSSFVVIPEAPPPPDDISMEAASGLPVPLSPPTSGGGTPAVEFAMGRSQSCCRSRSYYPGIVE